jgi:hypothetical protein
MCYYEPSSFGRNGEIIHDWLGFSLLLRIIVDMLGYA